jgi:GT2 family glycosyltransferase
VIIPTYRRPSSLLRCLDALVRQSRAPDQILVVARTDDEATHELVRSHESLARIVPIDVQAGRPGFVAALNAGIAASSGDIVAFTDDDAEPHADWIGRLADAFEDPTVGAVGGRDWLYEDGELESGEQRVVGKLSWFGRITGNHHLGTGAAREVSMLKGVNLSVRGDVLREIRFDERLLGVGTEHNSEIGMCLRLRKRGYRISYDPDIAVNHYREARAEGARSLEDDRLLRYAVHNETFAVLEYLPLHQKLIYLLWSVVIGTSTAPGLAQAGRSAITRGDPRLHLLRGALIGRAMGIQTFLRSRRHDASRSRPVATGVPTLLAIGHSPTAIERIHRLLDDSSGVIVCGPAKGMRGTARAIRTLLRSRAPVVYLVDIGQSTTMTAPLGRLLGKRVLLDTGDVAFELAKSVGRLGRLRLLAVGVGEQVALHSAHAIVVRGQLHARLVPRPATHIPDLPPEGARRVASADLLEELDLVGSFVVGLVGSLNYSPRRGTSYGWDLIEALRHTSSEVVALVVGDGDGLPYLRKRAADLGVTGRCRFVGAVPSCDVNAYISAMNVAISTQSNDVVGQVRTTGKLPLYLACGCPVLASHVGEAAHLLGPLGWTIPYHGVVDRTYPLRLAAAIESLRHDVAGESGRREDALRINRDAFDVEIMRSRLQHLLAQVT